MLPDVPIGRPIVEEVAKELTKGYCYKGREVKKSDRAAVKAIPASGNWSLQEDGGGDVDADSPHEGHGAVILLASGSGFRVNLISQ